MFLILVVLITFVVSRSFHFHDDDCEFYREVSFEKVSYGIVFPKFQCFDL